MTSDSSRRSRRQVPAYHRGDLPPAVDPAQLTCPLATRLKSRTSAASSLGREPCVFTRRRNSSWSRSIVFVVRSVFHCVLGKRKNVRSSSLLLADSLRRWDSACSMCARRPRRKRRVNYSPHSTNRSWDHGETKLRPTPIPIRRNPSKSDPPFLDKRWISFF